MSENLADRLDAVERALTDDETDLAAVRERAALSAEVDRLEARVEELEAQVEELNAAVEAVRGYTGNVRAVNREVERRASAALAKVEALESAVDGAGGAGDGRLVGGTVDPELDGSDPATERTVVRRPDATRVRGKGHSTEEARTAESRADGAWTDEGRTEGSRHGTANSGGVRNGGDSPGGDDPVGNTTVRNPDQRDERLSSGATNREGRPVATARGDRPGATDHEDRPGATGQDGQPGAGEHGTRRRAAACERRPTAIKEPGESNEDDERSGTEQFIERVRDAL